MRPPSPTTSLTTTTTHHQPPGPARCGKTNDAVVPQRLGGRNWKTVRQTSLLPQPSLSEQWAGEKSKYSPSRSAFLQSPSCSSFLAYNCPELYLARTKPLCHLFKGPFFLFLSLIFPHGLGILYYRLPPPPSLFYILLHTA